MNGAKPTTRENQTVNSAEAAGGSNNETTESFAKSKEKIKSNIKNAIEQIIKGEKEEVVIKNVRDDLEKYGGTNDVSFIKGNEKGGISHFSKKYKEDLKASLRH